MQQLGIDPPPRLPITSATSENDTNWGTWLKWLRRLTDATAKVQTFSKALTPVAVAATTTAEQTFTVSGLTTSDIVYLNKPTHQAGLGITNARISAANTLAIEYINTTGAPITPTAETYKIVAIRL